MSDFTILIGADLVPRKRNNEYFSEGRLDKLFGNNLLSLLKKADYRIFNLETPLTDDHSPISKDGPSLAAPASTIRGIKMLDPTILGLANNHIMDHGEQGLFDTLSVLMDNDILYTGAGKDTEHAARAVILEHNGKRIGIYACAEHEFSIAEKEKPGANPVDPLESPDHIANLKSECDFVIVLYHGGREYYRYPSPGLQKICRKLAEKGAGLIICQHSHCIGSFEKYKESTIIYGQGDFHFGGDDNEYTSNSLLVGVTLKDNITVNLIPMCRKGGLVEIASPEEAEKIMSEFNDRSGKISLPGYIEEQFDNHCMREGHYYLATCAGFRTAIRRIDKVLLNGLLIRSVYTRKKREILRNNIECEAHRELIIKYLRILGTR